MNATLALAGVVQMVACASFIAVGDRIRRRHIAGEAQLANLAMVSWWWSFSAYLALEAGFSVAGAFGHAGPASWTAGRVVSGPIICFAAASLAFHILYLFSGRRWLLWPLAVYYAAAALAYSYSVVAHDPIAVVPGEWALEVTYASPIEGPLWTAVLASVGLPMVLGSIAYLTLVFQVDRRDQKYRILMVGSSILVWVTSGYVAQVAGGQFVRFVSIAGFGLIAAAAVFMAYFPPDAVRRWLEGKPPPGSSVAQAR